MMPFPLPLCTLLRPVQWSRCYWTSVARYWSQTTTFRASSRLHTAHSFYLGRFRPKFVPEEYTFACLMCCVSAENEHIKFAGILYILLRVPKPSSSPEWRDIQAAGEMLEED